jgi:hypothetical protein
MTDHLRDPLRYREQAAHFLELAKGISDSPELRDSYLALALQYERIAHILDAASATSGEKAPSGVYIEDGKKARSQG